jgi:transposase
MRTPGTPAELEFRRRLAVQRLLDGYSADEVAAFLNVSPRTVWRWLALARGQGPEGLSAQPVSGRPPKLSHTQEKIVQRWVRDSPTKHGFATALWTAAHIAQLIEQEFGVTLNPRYLSSWLRDRDFTPQKPQRVPRERDPEKIQRWLASDWPRIKEKARRQGASLALIDESGLLMAPLVRRTWAPRGQTPVLVQKSGTREKVSVAAALWVSPRHDRLGLFSGTLVNGYFNNWYSAAFLEALLQELTGRVIVIWDGGTMHKGDPIRQLVDHFADRLCLEKLPPYAPMLNPIEFLWSWLKYSRLNNFAPRDAIQLNERVVAELAAIQKDQGLLESFVHATSLPLRLTLLT